MKKKIHKRCVSCHGYFHIYDTYLWANRPPVCSDKCLADFLKSMDKFKGDRKMVCSHREKPHYRSSYEITFADFLKSNGIAFEYEKYFLVDDKGVPYLPDFYLPKKNIFIEVKGLATYDRMYKYRKFADSGVMLLKDEDFRRFKWIKK